MNAIPPDLKAAIDRYLAENVAGSLVEKTSRMSEHYRRAGVPTAHWILAPILLRGCRPPMRR